MYKDYYKKQQYTVRNEGYKDEPMLIIAEDSSGRIVHIKEVPNGLDCNCICPKCRQRLVAKNNKDNERQSHFAHYDSSSNCHGAYMSAIHKLAEQIIYEEKMVMAPAYGSIDNTKLVFTEVELEKRGDRSDLQPDIVGITADGNRWAIEIRYTNEIGSKKTKKIKESGMICLEIDVRNQEQDKEKLKRFLTESTDYREWINNPLYDSKIAEEEKEKVNAIEKCLLNAKTLSLPECDMCNAMSIQIKLIDVKERRNNGRYSIIKVMSKGDIPYIIHIASQSILEDVYNSMDKPKKDELVIVTDQITNIEAITIEGLELQWLYPYNAARFIDSIQDLIYKDFSFKEKFFINCKKLPSYRSLYIFEDYYPIAVREFTTDFLNKLEDDMKPDLYNSEIHVSEGFLNFSDDNNYEIKNRKKCSLDDFFNEHRKTNTILLENGESAVIRKMDKFEERILILCDFSYYENKLPFQIYSITLEKGKIKKSCIYYTNSISDAKSMYLTTSFISTIIEQS